MRQGPALLTPQGKCDRIEERGGTGALVGGVLPMRVGVTLACTQCKERNYTTSKNKRKNPDRLELRKYCPRCRSHTIHRETR